MSNATWICSPFDDKSYSGGFISGNNPFDHVIPLISFHAILVFFTSRTIYFVIKPLKQPKIISDILGGVILGPSFLSHNKAFKDRIFPPREMMVDHTISRIGIIYFIFVASVKMDKSMMFSTFKKSWNIGLTGFIVPFTITLCISKLLYSHIAAGVSAESVIFLLTTSLSVSYFAVVAHALSELNLLNSELGRIALSCALIKDMVGWTLTAFALAIKPEGVTKEVVYGKISLLALVLFGVFVLRPALQWIIRTTPEGKPVKQIYIIVILLGPLVMGMLSEMFDKTSVPGAIVLGLIIPAGPPLGSIVVEKCESVNTNFFLPYLFIRIGVLTNIYSLKNWKAVASIELIIIASFVGKILGALLSLLFFKGGIRNAILLGLILNIKGIVDFLVFLRWITIQLINEEVYTVFVLSQTLLTAIITPLIRLLYKPKIRTLEAGELSRIRMRTLQTTPLDSELRILCGLHYEDSVHSFISLLKASNTNAAGPICAYVVHLVELVGRATPLLIPYDIRKKRLIPNSTDHIMRAMLKYVKTSSVPVAIQPFTIIAEYNNMHEHVCNLAQDKFIPFIVIPFHKTRECDGKSASLRKFNLNMQAYSPCTVGIFVDRGMPRSLSSTHFSYNVAVFFLGGVDDREAMALATRMSRHPEVSITLFRLFLEEDNQEENESERRLDECVINVFQAMNLGNASAVCREIVAENTMELVEAIRSVENNYDLVIVGKRRRPKSVLEKEMKPWVECAELGVIGDMVASADFCCGMMSVLVIQCFGDVDGASVRVMSVTDATSEISSFFSSNCDRDHTHLIDSFKGDDKL